MIFDNLILLNFMFTTVLAFIVYRQYVIGRFERQREVEQLHQEIRNNVVNLTDRLHDMEDRHDRDLMEIYRDLDSMTSELPKKKTTGLNSRIPL